ncbi:MAG: CpaF family protein, partial [Devosia sp.]
MFGKRTTFGGNTPGVGEVARPIPSPARPEPAPAQPVQRRASDGDSMAARQRTTDEVLDVRNPVDVQRDKEYFQTKSA